jgi:hypothetical protein
VTLVARLLVAAAFLTSTFGIIGVHHNLFDTTSMNITVIPTALNSLLDGRDCSVSTEQVLILLDFGYNYNACVNVQSPLYLLKVTKVFCHASFVCLVNSTESFVILEVCSLMAIVFVANFESFVSAGYFFVSIGGIFIRIIGGIYFFVVSAVYFFQALLVGFFFEGEIFLSSLGGIFCRVLKGLDGSFFKFRRLLLAGSFFLYIDIRLLFMMSQHLFCISARFRFFFVRPYFFCISPFFFSIGVFLSRRFC